MSIKLEASAVRSAAAEMVNAAQIPGGVSAIDEFEDQVIAFILALHKNAERERRYKGLWREDTIGELGEHIVHKGKRMAVHSIGEAMGISDADDATDDALDVINYGAFIARKVHYAAKEAGLTGPEEA